MPIIEAKNLVKTYRVFQKKPGLGGALVSLVRRKYKEVRAVDGVSFTIEPGEMVAVLGQLRESRARGRASRWHQLAGAGTMGPV